MLRWLRHEEEASDAEDVAAAKKTRQGEGMSAGVDAEKADDAEKHDVPADEDQESRQGGLLVTHGES